MIMALLIRACPPADAPNREPKTTYGKTTFTGERARLMAENESRAKEYMEVYGTVFTEETPDCQAKIGNWILPLLLLAITVYFIYIVRMWGFPIVAVALFITLYTLITSAVWYFDWSDNRYLTTAIGTISDGVRNYSAGVEGARNALISDSNGLLGQSHRQKWV